MYVCHKTGEKEQGQQRGPYEDRLATTEGRGRFPRGMYMNEPGGFYMNDPGGGILILAATLIWASEGGGRRCL